MTHIFFLLCRGQVSHLHRIASDELWHFYGGDPLTVVEADPSAGAIRETTLGRSRPFHSVKGGVWFGARPEGEWSLGEHGATPAQRPRQRWALRDPVAGQRSAGRCR